MITVNKQCKKQMKSGKLKVNNGWKEKR